MAKKEPQARGAKIAQALKNWWQPLKWVTFLVILALYLMDMKHVYELFIFHMNSQYAYAPATFFGFQLPTDNRTFDASGFSVMITALTYLLSQYIPKRLGNAEPAKLWVSAFVGALTISGLANANALVEDITGQQISVFGDNFWIWVIVGFFITYLLAFFVGVEAWDLLRKKRAELAEQEEAHRLEFMNSPQYKNAPNKYKQGVLAKRGLTIPTGDTQSPVRLGKTKRVLNAVRSL